MTPTAEYYRQQETERAKRLLVYYFESAGVILTGDTIVEIGEIVDAIINAARGAP